MENTFFIGLFGDGIVSLKAIPSRMSFKEAKALVYHVYSVLPESEKTDLLYEIAMLDNNGGLPS